QILSVGISTFVRQIGVSVVAIAVNYQLSIYGGDLLIASYGIINKFISLFLMPMFGIAQGAQPLIGYNFGAGFIDRVKKTLKLSQVYCVIIGAIGFLGALLIPKLILSIFTSDVELISISVLPLRIIFSTLILVAISTVGSTLFQATGKGKEAFFLNLLRQIILFLPLVFILPLFLGVNGIWFSFFIGEFITAVITLLMTKRGLTKMEKESHLVIPKNS
ncbi:MAG: MATE family efflux transporter, partial [Sphaerochaetaceae bacterium]